MLLGVGADVTCKTCQDRRNGLMQALSKADAIKAAEHMMKGLAEMVGIKKKPESDDTN